MGCFGVPSLTAPKPSGCMGSPRPLLSTAASARPPQSPQPTPGHAASASIPLCAKVTLCHQPRGRFDFRSGGSGYGFVLGCDSLAAGAEAVGQGRRPGLGGGCALVAPRALATCTVSRPGRRAGLSAADGTLPSAAIAGPPHETAAFVSLGVGTNWLKGIR